MSELDKAAEEAKPSGETPAAVAPTPEAAPPMAEPSKPDPPKTDPTKTNIVSQWKHSAPLFSCRYEPQGRYIFTGARDNLVTRWDAKSGAATPLLGHESWVRGIAFSPDGETTITGGHDGRLIWWPTAAEKPEPIRKLDAHPGGARAVAVNPAGDIVASVGNDRLVRLWRLADGQPLQTLAAHASHVYSVLFHPSGEFVLSGDLAGQVHQWEVTSGKLVRTFDASALHNYDKGFSAHCGGVRSISLSADGKHLACSGLHNNTNAFAGIHDAMVIVLEWESQKLVQTHVGAGGVKGIAWRAAYHPDGYLIGATESQPGLLLFWKLTEAEEFFRFSLPNPTYDMALSPDGMSVATAHADHHLRVSKLNA